MTSTVKVTSHNFPVLVQTLNQDGETTEERVLQPQDGEVTFYVTTTQGLGVKDIEYDDPRVPKPE